MKVRQEPEERQFGIDWRQADEVGVNSVSWRDTPSSRIKRGVGINLCQGEREEGLRITVSRVRARQIAIALAHASGMQFQRCSPFRRLPQRLSHLLNKHTAEIVAPASAELKSGGAELIDDLRQGVTPAGHAVLDCLEAQQEEWGDLYDTAGQLKMAHARARNALYSSDYPAKQRQYAIEAAARLIDVINEMDREIAVESAPSVHSDGGAQ